MLTSDQEKTYQAALDRAVYFDLSAYGKIEAAGKDAATFLHNLCTNDIKNLQSGTSCEAFLCNAKARTIAHLFVNRVPVGVPALAGVHGDTAGTPTLLLDMVPALGDKVFQHLNKYLISEQVELTNRTHELAMFRIVGPQAREMLAAALHTTVPDGPFLQFLPDTVSQRLLIRPHQLLGLPGYDLFVAMADANQLRHDFLQADVALASQEVHDVLRIAAGLPEYGKDMDDERFVVEVGRTTQAICYTKGCYLGQEPIVMARDRGQVNRMLMGIKIVSDSFAPLPHGARLFHADAEVGQVMSSAWSPRLRQGIALAYVRRGHQQPGTELVLEPATDGRKAIVASLPLAA